MTVVGLSLYDFGVQIDCGSSGGESSDGAAFRTVTMVVLVIAIFPFTLRSLYDRYEMMVDYLFLGTVAGVGLFLNIMASIKMSHACGVTGEVVAGKATAEHIILIFCSASMFLCGSTWFRKAAVIGAIIVTFALHEFVIFRDVVGKDVALQSVVAVFLQGVIISVSGYHIEKISRLEFASKWHLATETLLLTEKVEAMEGSQESLETELGEMRFLDLRTPLEKCIHTLNTIKKAPLFEHMKKHIQDVTDVLENHYETSLYHVDVMKAASKDIHKDKAEMDGNMREWLLEKLTPPEARLATQLLSREVETDLGNITSAARRSTTNTSNWMRSARESLKLTDLESTEDFNALFLEQDTPFISQIGLCPEGSQDLVTDDLIDALSRIRSWNFDVMEFAKMSDGHPLYYIVMDVLQVSNVADDFCIGTVKLQRFLTKIDTRYCYKPDKENPYHNVCPHAFLTFSRSGT
jgi:hypothetical protein